MILKERQKRLSFLNRKDKKRIHLSHFRAKMNCRKPKKRLERHYREYLEAIELDKRIVRFVNYFMEAVYRQQKGKAI